MLQFLYFHLNLIMLDNQFNNYKSFICSHTIAEFPESQCGECYYRPHYCLDINVVNITLLLFQVVNPETGEECGVGEPGEILIAGPCIMKGYYNNPKATKGIPSLQSLKYLHPKS